MHTNGAKPSGRLRPISITEMFFERKLFMALCRLDAFQMKDNVRFLGRCFEDADRQAVWFNWSLAGFALRFRGRELRACFISVDEDMTAPFEHEAVTLSPVIGVHVDGGELRRFKLSKPRQWLSIFSGEYGDHSAEIRKISENVMGKCALCALETDGEFLAPPSPAPLRIEFVGDSITCAYGVEATEPGFRTEDENSEAGYSFLAAKALGADYSAICVTGCGVAEPVYFPRMVNRGMLSMYAHTDTPLERLWGRTNFRCWDFSANPSDAIVINLGTNDANEISMLGFTRESVEHFRRSYRELLELIRRLNGPEPWLICTLGSMDYYLWDEILAVAHKFAEETGDKRIVCEKMGKLNSMTEGLGADTHPSAVSHRRMGLEMADILRRTLGI